MAFAKKKQFKFDVNLKVEELLSVPLVNAVVFCKIRFVGGGSRLIGLTPGEELIDHRVIWNQYFQFPCKMTANNITMELEPVYCRISIRRELKGGKTHQKIGFVDLNLAEYAGSGNISRRYLLEGYSSTSRLDNSLLKLNLSLTLVCGDLCFKVPKSHGSLSQETQDCLRRPPSIHQMSETGVRTILITSSNQGIQHSTQNLREIHDQHSGNCDGSQPPKSHDSSSLSSSSTLLQSRSNSENAINKKCVNRNSANFSSSSMPRNSGKERRTDISRVDADKLIDDIIRSTDLNLDSCGEAGGLQLIVRKDGTTILSSIPGGDSSNALITINS